MFMISTPPSRTRCAWTMGPTPTATYRLTDMHGHIVKEILSV